MGTPSSPYDLLDDEGQAAVRAAWDLAMDARREALDFSVEFSVEGRSWVELDQNGEVVERFGVSGVPESFAPASTGVEQLRRVRGATPEPGGEPEG